MGHGKGHSDGVLKSLEADLNVRLPSELWDLYQTIQDPLRSESSPFRLMSAEEVKDTREATNHFYSDFSGFNWWNSCAFWSDDNSNYAGIYLDGPLLGRIYFLDHDQPDLSFDRLQNDCIALASDGYRRRGETEKEGQRTFALRLTVNVRCPFLFPIESSSYAHSVLQSHSYLRSIGTNAHQQT